MQQRLNKLEEQYPEYVDENSRTKRVGDIKIKKFEKVSHNVLILKLCQSKYKMI